MKILNLIDCNNSDISYYITCFPDGENQIKLEEFSRKEKIEIKCRICNATDLFILCQVMDILDRHEVLYEVSIFYLMGMRMDRVMDFNRPFTHKIVLGILNKYNFYSCNVFVPHSNDFMVNYDLKNGMRYCEVLLPYNIYLNFADCQVVFPDKGASERGLPWTDNIIHCTKERDIETGKLSNFKITNPNDFDGRPLVIVDDLCDGGGTFIGLLKVLRKQCPNTPINIYVTHMVNKQGLLNLAKNFDHVWFTNSYYDWKNGFIVNGEKWPENITQIDVINSNLY